MGAIADYATYKAKLEQGSRRGILVKVGTNRGGFVVMSNQNQDAATAPGSAVALYRDSPGSMLFRDVNLTPASGKQLWLVRNEAKTADVSGSGTAFVIDRLVWNSGLSSNTEGEQTTNLPTPTLPRYADGKGVMMAVVWWGTPGLDAGTMVASYTNQDGVSGRTSQETVLGGNGSGVTQAQIIYPQDGDTGVRSVESVTVLGGTTSNADFGILLFKPLGFFAPWHSHLYPNHMPARELLFGGAIQEVHEEACLELAYFCSTVQQRTLHVSVDIIEA